MHNTYIAPQTATAAAAALYVTDSAGGFLIQFAKPKPVRIKPCEPVPRRFTA